jgi:hypothetical protein
MNKKRKMLIAALVTGLLIVVFTGVAFAIGPVTPNIDCPSDGSRPGGSGHGMGVYFGQGALEGITSDLLDLSAGEIQAQRLGGKSLVEIAASVGVSEDTLVAAFVEAKCEIIQQLAADGILTQEQAAFMTQNVEQQTTLAVNRTGTGPFSQTGNGMGRGNMHRWAQIG